MLRLKNPKQLLLELYSGVPAFWITASVISWGLSTRGSVPLHITLMLKEQDIYLNLFISHCHKMRSFSTFISYLGPKPSQFIPLLARHTVN